MPPRTIALSTWGLLLCLCGCHGTGGGCIPQAEAAPGQSPAPEAKAANTTARSASAKAKPQSTPAALSSVSAAPPPSAGAPPEPSPSAAKATLSAEPEPAAPSACPAGMQLVDGDYCSKVEHECLNSWYDKSNKKTVCEKFSGKSTCVGTKTPKRFCIDKYEWPNRAGERPEVMNRFHQAEVKCAAVGKRLCTESEWTMACEGPKLWPFPYGFERDVDKCHGDVMWDSPNMSLVAARDKEELARLWKGVRSGSQPECVSAYGVYDLPGNADEVVSSETFTADFRGKFDSVHTGGPWYKGVRNQCRPKIYTHDEGFYYYFLSFRCCAEPDGKVTEPRTTRQTKERWSFEKVERIAGFSREDVKKTLARKAKDRTCGCGEKDIHCRTICGTLLGPGAKDFDKSQRAPAGDLRHAPAAGEAPKP